MTVRILIDESLPRYLKQMLAEHQPLTVQEMGWAGIKNGDLLAKAESRFDVFLTADKNLRYQQNIQGHDLAVIVFPSNRLSVVQSLADRLSGALGMIEPGEIVEL